jgi:hypothetical protein
MSQFGRPSSDITVADWTTSPLWSKIDEATFSDADLISSNNNTNNACEVALSAVTDPLGNTGHVVRYRYRKNAAAGNARDITVALVQGATVRASATHTGISETFTAGSFTLASGEADAITDYADLRLRFTPGGTTGGSGGNRRSVEVSWAELEVPDVPVTATRTVPAAVAVRTLNQRTVGAAVGVSVPATPLDPNGFDAWRGGDPVPVLPGGANTAGLGYWRGGEPLPALATAAGGPETFARTVPAEVAIQETAQRAVPAEVAVATLDVASAPAGVAIATAEARTVGAAVGVQAT